MVTIRFTCLVGGRENGKEGVVDHLGERNEEGGMVTFSYVVWYEIHPILSPI